MIRTYGIVRVHIGDEYVDVPPEYIQEESNYCRVEFDAFFKCSDDHPDKDTLRQKVLDKRVEFYRQYQARKEG